MVRPLKLGRLHQLHMHPGPGAIFNSTLVREIARVLPGDYSDKVWDQLTPDLVQRTLDGPVKAAAADQYKTLWHLQNNRARGLSQQDPIQAVTTKLQQETAVASMLLDFKNRGAIGDLKHIIYDSFQFKRSRSSSVWALPTILSTLSIRTRTSIESGFHQLAWFTSSANTSLNSTPSLAYPSDMFGCRRRLCRADRGQHTQSDDRTVGRGFNPSGQKVLDNKHNTGRSLRSGQAGQPTKYEARSDCEFEPKLGVGQCK